MVLGVQLIEAGKWPVNGMAAQMIWVTVPGGYYGKSSNWS